MGDKAKESMVAASASKRLGTAEGKAEPASDHAPIYLRKSQAERELEAKGKKLEE